MNSNCQINGVQVIVQPDANQASRCVAELFADQIRRKPDSVLGLATGGTPIDTYRRLIEMNRDVQINFQNVTSFNLDEYIGLSSDHPQSYRVFMNDKLFDHINIALDHTFVPDGCAADIPLHCDQYESKIKSAGGIDMQLLGLGHNGHIAFNEPGSPATSRTRQVDLTLETIEKNARFFDSAEQVPRHAITMGIATILESREIVLLALGEEKSAAVARMLQNPVSESNPSSLLRKHNHVTVVLDQGAASDLEVIE